MCPSASELTGVVMPIGIRTRGNLLSFFSGQTMTEYALILAAVAIVVYAGYLTMGSTINEMLSTVDSKL